MKLKEFNEKEFLEHLKWLGVFPIKTLIKEYIKEKTFGLVNEEDVYNRLKTTYELYQNFPLCSRKTSKKEVVNGIWGAIQEYKSLSVQGLFLLHTMPGRDLIYF